MTTARPGQRHGTGAAFYISIGMISSAVIALQICVMRIFAVGSWTHFGSMVISLAMLGFGLSSVVLFSSKAWFERHWWGSAGASLFAFGPLTVASNLAAQAVPFNAVFLVSDPAQKWRLLANFVVYLLPFLSAALFLGIVFLKGRSIFDRLYFADLIGAGFGGVVVLGGLYLVAPERILVVPLGLWALAVITWLTASGPIVTAAALGGIVLSVAAYFALPGLLGVPALSVNPYKGISYARNFPDAERIYRKVSPFGDLQIYRSSYMHFAPGLSDNAAFNLPELPADTYTGMFVDGDGPEGIMGAVPTEDRAYFRYLPAFYPYVVKHAPRTFIVQFGGGISTRVALQAGSRLVTAAESNPAIVRAFEDPALRVATAAILGSPRLRLLQGDGRLVLERDKVRYDVIDLSLADSIGLSNPGGFAVVEKYLYTEQAMRAYMRALAPGGVLAVTVWNKEEPPKSVLKLYATIARAARTQERGTMARNFFVASSYLSTTTVLYKRGGFADDEIARLRDYTQAMSFDEVYWPGFPYETAETPKILSAYRGSIFGSATMATSGNPTASETSASSPSVPDGTAAENSGTSEDGGASGNGEDATMPSTTMNRLAWHYLINGGWRDIARQYVFDVRPLTDERPYFAGYERPSDLLRTLDRLDLFQDDWGYLVLWVALGIALVAILPLIALPVALGWRSALVRTPGKASAISYFACLGLGYITVEVGLIERFTVALGSPAVSATVMLSGILVCSGLGSLFSGRLMNIAPKAIPIILVLISALLFAFSRTSSPLLDWVGGLSYWARLALAITVVAPAAFLMGFPMAAGMVWLARLGREHLFVWGWGVNSCFSVVGAVLVPIVAVTSGLDTVIELAAVAYLLAAPAFLGLSKDTGNPALEGS